MSLPHLAGLLRKDLSTDMIRTKIAHRKSLSRKENRHKEYERNRHFGLRDVNVPLQRSVLTDIHETSQDFAPEKASTKPQLVKSVLSDQRKQMLQKYKEEKQLQKLKEQREKAKRGIFKVGLYRPDVPGFLITSQKVTKAEPKKAIPTSGRITRSMITKDQMEQTKVANRSAIQVTQSEQRHASDKVLDKEKKVVQPMVSTSARVTRSAAQATKQIARTIPSTTMRKPVTRAANYNEPERKAPSKGRPAKKIETKPDKVISSKIDSEEKTLSSQTHATSEMDPDGVLSEMENLPRTSPAKVKGKSSFAPKDFMFQPLDGLKIYQVAPMTPRSANAFLTPSYDWNPLKSEIDTTQEATKEILTQKYPSPSTRTVQHVSNKSQCPLESPTFCNEEHVLNQNEGTTKNSNSLSKKEVASLEVREGQISQPQHDVPYFRNTLQSETERLTSYCLEWDGKLELDIPDDAKDLIRTAVGQTRLLIKERFKQFEGLVDDCEYKRGEKETTCTDLDGFWDMVSFQVEDLNNKFNGLIKLEESGWQTNNNPCKKVLPKKVILGVANKPKQDDGRRIAARNRLAAIKNAMRERLKQEGGPEAAAAETPKEVDKIVFDAGFFRVESPVKSFSVRSSEHHSQRFGTPKSISKAVAGSRVKMDLLGQRMSLENPDPQNNKREHVHETLFSNVLESRNSTAEDAQCPASQGLTEVNHDINKINFKVDCSPNERVSLCLLAGGKASDINSNHEEAAPNVMEGMELNSSIDPQDVLMSSPEKNVPSQNSISQEEAETSHSVPFNKSLATECHLLDSPDLSYSDPYTQVESRHQEHSRNFSFGGNLIAFSPLRSLSGKQPGGL